MYFNYQKRNLMQRQIISVSVYITLLQINPFVWFVKHNWCITNTQSSKWPLLGLTFYPTNISKLEMIQFTDEEKKQIIKF